MAFALKGFACLIKGFMFPTGDHNLCLSVVNPQPFVFLAPLPSCVLALKIYQTLSNESQIIRIQELLGETDSDIPREGFHHFD